ncbi:CocE/NonD family hydrolase [Flectobacillus roseus]|uniref:CocE/NonD family hydrolase n=1 Tax=Flectobacillus roseus TaxID=502259 RepID=UPI0024B7369C|nr:CocE/NonD family hydrolase [Flectobacillus roseus]MDI9871127.1 CocE/NonD family hydrolase [Flectobacillus roseus]
MKKLFLLLSLLVGMTKISAQSLSVAQQDSAFVRENYVKYQYQISMRDGVKLFTNVYVPKDASANNKYPIVMQRTCYDIAPYGKDDYPQMLYYSRHMMREKFIFVEQDVRGRWMSEGTWTNMTPHIANKKAKTDVDEASDTYDTIDWLVKNVPNNNGRVGQYGISYPGFYTIAGALCGHPALKASSPQAPVSDFFFDDFHHNGAFTIGYGLTFPVFGVQHPKPTTESWYDNLFPKRNTQDGFDWYKTQTPLKNLGANYKDNFFWQEHVDHPNYDEFWQKRSIIPHLKNIKNAPAIMVVGGWYDAEDLYGPLTIYKNVEKNNQNIYNTIVMGPFGHGDWARERGHHMHSNVYFGDSVATFFQRNIELKFFKHFLKGAGDGKSDLPEAYLFDTGKKQWQEFKEWPVKTAQKVNFYLSNSGKLTDKITSDGYSEFVSDPNKPVPYTEDNKQLFGFTPRAYMSEDQRFAGRRTDVLTFETDVLTEDVTLGGEILAKLKVATTGTDADWFVKLVDVYPGDEQNTPFTPKHITLAGYQQMVRSEIMRSRFRNSFSKPEPLVPNQITDVTFRLQDVLHTFKKGHKIMIQVQSTAFPLFDINPQKYVDNIYKADAADFIKATHKVYNSSAIEVEILK